MVSIKPSSLINMLANTAQANKAVFKPANFDKARFAARMALISALTKDAVGCYYYVTQSLDNERIPEEKRKFVAAIDLMNGILNVGLQFTIGAWLDKKAPVWFDNIMNKKASTEKTRDVVKFVDEELKGKCKGKGKSKKIINYICGEVDDLSKVSIEAIENSIRSKKLLGKSGNISKILKVGYSAAIMLIATQVITKRIIVPFLATPLASWYKKRFLDKKGPEVVANRVSYEWASLSPREKNNKAAVFNKLALK